MRGLTNYDKLPTIPVSDDLTRCLASWQAIVDELAIRIPANGRFTLVVGWYPGTDREEIKDAFRGFPPALVLSSESALKSEEAAEAFLAPWLGDELEFIKTRRHWFTKSVPHDTLGKPECL